jgi:hypothetical protein
VSDQKPIKKTGKQKEEYQWQEPAQTFKYSAPYYDVKKTGKKQAGKGGAE